ncbi:MAG: hypothetical protein F2789_11900 [Actinobacteria bacterium]|nr:hypothetical protein [Actinomycetota bacterium]
MALSIALTALLGSALALPSGPAKADPLQYSAFVGTGSDTVQDVMNAFAGSSNGTAYTPVKSTSGQQIISFDATIPAGGADSCITAKLGGPTFTRPNGSGAGIKVLWAASGGSSAGWTGSAIGTTPICASAVDISGQVDYARSSSGPTSGDSGTNLTYIPFGRDGVSFAYYRAAGSPVTSLTRAQLVSLFTTGPQTIGGVRIVPCGIQTSSGTYKFWNTVTTASTTTEGTSTTECNALLGRAEENDGTGLKARGDAAAAVAGHANDQVIIGFSAAAFIAKSNLAAAGAPPAGVGMGSISDNSLTSGGTDLGSPVSGSAPNLTPSSTFYDDATFGRNVYVVLPTTVATGAGNAQIKSLFVSSTNTANDAKICLETTTIQKFGFRTISSCGSTATKGSWSTGVS